MKTPLELAREMRKNPTPEEDRLWQLLRRKQLKGYKFYRQHPFVYKTINNQESFFILDFFCHSHKLVVELDGGIHKLKTEEDAVRDFILLELGIKTLRILNEEFNKVSVEMILQKILRALEGN